MKTCAYYQAPVDGNPIVAVFENPTWREYALGRPVTGVAGANLCVIFRLLRLMFRTGELKRIRIRETDLYKCRCAIVDASREKYSNSRDRSNDEFKQGVENNAETLQRAIGKDKIVICFGARARRALNMLKNKCRPKIQINVCQLSNAAISRFAVLDRLIRELHLTEAMFGMVPLIVIAEYICGHLRGKKVGEFRDFYNGFRRGGNGRFPVLFKSRLTTVVDALEARCCSTSCENLCCCKCRDLMPMFRKGTTNAECNIPENA